VAVGGLAFALALAFVPLARRVALRRGLTDQPSEGRWHGVPTPYLGGLALAAAFLGGSAFVRGWERDTALLVGAAAAVSLLGLVDDVRTVSPVAKLAVEFTAAAAAFAAGCRIDIGPIGIDFVLSVVAIVVVTNGFNLLDNIDGALGSVAAIVAIGIGATAIMERQYLVAGLALALAGGTLGFLVHNWHPASIFMGDAGSLFLGFLLASLTLRLEAAVGPTTGAVVALLLVGPALFDTVLVVISRVRARRSILVGGTDHTSHRLVRRGFETRTAVALIAAGSAVSSALAVAVAEETVPASVALAVIVVVAAGLLAVFLRQPVYECRDS
jgi:UDP-GlcNAc:undecaprenyl-phosphate GlcNAc-1-phosphate transferase